MKSDRARYLIIGNSTAAIGGVEGIRRFDPETPIVLVSREPYHTYSRPLISYLLAGEVDEEQMYYRPRDFYKLHRVDARLGVEAVGVEATMDAAVQNIQKGGTIVVLGVFGEKPRIDMSIVGDREQTIIGTLMYKHEDYVKAVELIAAGDVITEPLVTKHFPFKQYADAYKFIDAQGDKTLKVMIDL